MRQLLEIAEDARRAKYTVAKLGTNDKNRALLAIADALEARADEIIAANAGKIFYLKDGKTLWNFPGKISDIAVLGDCIAVSGDKLLLLDRNGKLLDTQNYHLTALAASGKWLLAASPERKGILRFQLKQEKK